MRIPIPDVSIGYLRALSPCVASETHEAEQISIDTPKMQILFRSRSISTEKIWFKTEGT